MENYRRPQSAKRAERHTVDGFIPAKTKTAEPNVQPFRDAVIKQQAQRGLDAPRPQAPAIDMALPEGDSRNRHHLQPRIKKQVRTARKVAFRGALIAMALLIGGGGLLFSQGYLNIRKIFKGTAVSAASLQKNVNPNLLKGEGDGRINLLLTGIGGKGHDGGDLTDTLMLASIDPVNHTASLLSVPRDLWVTLPGKGSMKINAAYATAKYAYLHKATSDNSDSQAIAAGFTSIDQTIERVLGVPINYNLLVNFQAFRQAVDTVGGVTVNVPTDLYDPTMAWENDHNAYLARAGVQTFDGTHALIYVRSRETSSDFARSERQRAVLLALKQKAVTVGVLANPSKLAGLMGAFGDNVQTDLSLSDASRLYSIFKQIKNSDIQSISLAGTTTTTSSAAAVDGLVTTGTINGQSIVMPKAGLEDYSAIQDFVRSHLKDGYITKEHARVAILNGTIQKDLGDTMAAKLRSYGYTVTSVGQAPSTGYPSTVVVDQAKAGKKYTRHYLEQRFSTSAVKTMPDASIPPINADFVVVLGGDSL